MGTAAKPTAIAAGEHGHGGTAALGRRVRPQAEAPNRRPQPVEEVQTEERRRGDVDGRDPRRPQADHDVVVHAAGSEAGMQDAEREVEHVIADEREEERAPHAHACGRRARTGVRGGGTACARPRRPARARQRHHAGDVDDGGRRERRRAPPTAPRGRAGSAAA